MDIIEAAFNHLKIMTVYDNEWEVETAFHRFQCLKYVHSIIFSQKVNAIDIAITGNFVEKVSYSVIVLQKDHRKDPYINYDLCHWMN